VNRLLPSLPGGSIENTLYSPFWQCTCSCFFHYIFMLLNHVFLNHVSLNHVFFKSCFFKSCFLDCTVHCPAYKHVIKKIVKK